MIMKFGVTVFTKFIKISMITVVCFFGFSFTFLTKSHLIVLIYDCFNFIAPSATINAPPANRGAALSIILLPDS